MINSSTEKEPTWEITLSIVSAMYFSLLSAGVTMLNFTAGPAFLTQARE